MPDIGRAFFLGDVIVRFTEKSGKCDSGPDWLILLENIFADALEDDDDDVCCLIAGKRIIGPPASLNALSCMCHLSSLRRSNSPTAIRVLKLHEKWKSDKFRAWYESSHSNEHDTKHYKVVCNCFNSQMFMWYGQCPLNAQMLIVDKNDSITIFQGVYVFSAVCFSDF